MRPAWRDDPLEPFEFRNAPPFPSHHVLTARAALPNFADGATVGDARDEEPLVEIGRPAIPCVEVVARPDRPEQLQLRQFLDLFRQLSSRGLFERFPVLDAAARCVPDLPTVARVASGHQEDPLGLIEQDHLRRDTPSRATHVDEG